MYAPAREAVRLQDRGGEQRRRRLAVGADHVQRPEPPLRVAEPPRAAAASARGRAACRTRHGWRAGPRGRPRALALQLGEAAPRGPRPHAGAAPRAPAPPPPRPPGRDRRSRRWRASPAPSRARRAPRPARRSSLPRSAYGERAAADQHARVADHDRHAAHRGVDDRGPAEPGHEIGLGAQVRGVAVARDLQVERLARPEAGVLAHPAQLGDELDHGRHGARRLGVLRPVGRRGTARPSGGRARPAGTARSPPSRTASPGAAGRGCAPARAAPSPMPPGARPRRRRRGAS